MLPGFARLTVDPSDDLLQYVPAIRIAFPVIRITYKNQRVSLKVRQNDVSNNQFLHGSQRTIGFSVTDNAINSIVRKNRAVVDAPTTESVLPSIVLGFPFQRKAISWAYMVMATVAHDSAATRSSPAAAKTPTKGFIFLWHDCLREMR